MAERFSCLVSVHRTGRVRRHADVSDVLCFSCLVLRASHEGRTLGPNVSSQAPIACSENPSAPVSADATLSSRDRMKQPSHSPRRRGDSQGSESATCCLLRQPAEAGDWRVEDPIRAGGQVPEALRSPPVAHEGQGRPSVSRALHDVSLCTRLMCATIHIASQAVCYRPRQVLQDKWCPEAKHGEAFQVFRKILGICSA